MSATVTLLLGVYGYRYRAVPGTRAFIASMAIGTLWSVSNALEISATTLEVKLFWANLQYIAYALAPVSWIMMVLIFSGKAHWVNRRNVFFLLIVPVITIALVWTDTLHGLVRTNIRLDISGAFPVIAKDYGPWFWVHFSQCYLLNFSSIFFLLEATRQKSIAYQGQSTFLLFGTVLIVLTNLLYVSKLGPVRRYDISPIVFSISGMLIAYGIFRFRLFDLVPIARDNVIEAMENMVLVVDATDRIVDLNPACQGLSDTPYRALIGKPLRSFSAEVARVANAESKTKMRQEEFSQIVNGAHRHFEMNVSPIRYGGSDLMGRVIVINDLTVLKQAQDQINSEQQELAVMAERDRMAKDLHDNLGQILSFAGIQVEAAQLEQQRGHLELANCYLQRLKEIIKQAHQEMRDYVYSMRASEFEKTGIDRILKKQIGTFIENSGIFTWADITLELGEYDFSGEEKIQVANIVKEALNNVMKHAHASAVTVTLRRVNGWHELMIEDNGMGFVVPEERGSKQIGSGLQIMGERTRLLGGQLTITSQPGSYTRVLVKFPGHQGGHCHAGDDRG